MNRRNRTHQWPHASEHFPSAENPWSTVGAASGSTPTENLLLDLARDSFLSLWSFPNVYTDEGRTAGRGDGKELCDLMIVFGNDVLLFSDKNCAFPEAENLDVSWNRWYRRAVQKSANQLAGAEKVDNSIPNPNIFGCELCEESADYSSSGRTMSGSSNCRCTRSERGCDQTLGFNSGGEQRITNTRYTRGRPRSRGDPFCSRMAFGR